MNGVHDMGGMHGFGPVDIERDEPVFHQRWEGIVRAMMALRANVLAKGTWFLSTPRWGSHSVVFGYDSFDDMRAADNHQSGSDWRIFGTTAILRDGDVFPVFNNDGRSTVIQWNPILVATRGYLVKLVARQAHKLGL